MKIALWFLTFILLTFVSKTVPGQQVEWKRYRVQEAEFSIELPTIPSMAITYRHNERILGENTRLLKLVAMGADIRDVRLSRFFSSLKLGNGELLFSGRVLPGGGRLM